jgi:chromosome partitioning protein
VLGHLRSTQNYVRLVMEGLTLFDVPPSRVERDLADWQAICTWLDN